MNTHRLKIWPEHYNNVKAGTKTFEIRKNDRAFQKGDVVELCEFNQELADLGDGYTGYTSSEMLTFKIGDVYPIDAERVVFSLLKMEEK